MERLSKQRVIKVNGSDGGLLVHLKDDALGELEKAKFSSSEWKIVVKDFNNKNRSMSYV